METKPLLSSKLKGDPRLSPRQQQIMMEETNQQNYDSATNNNSNRQDGEGGLASSKSSGRGKLRFNKRQQMKLKQQQQKIEQSPPAVGIYNSIFPSKRNNIHGHHHGKDDDAANTKNKSMQQLNSHGGNTSSMNIDTDKPTTFQPPPTSTKSKHTQLYTILNPKSKSPQALLFQTTMATIIILDAIIYIISTEPQLQYLHQLFYIIEGVTSTIFLVELIARLVVCTEKKCYGKYGPIRGRWRYMYSFQGMIDSFATLPFFIELFTGIDLPTLTYLRVFRLIRITRTRSYTKAVDAVGRVLYFNREILHVAALLGLYLVVVTSVLMYYLRPQGVDVDGVDDISDFESIGSTMVLSIMMLTGQGGPSGKLPWYTQAIVLLTGIFSVAMFAIPASMLTWGFEAEAQRLGIKAKRRALAKRKGVVYRSDSSSSSGSSDGSSVSCIGDISTSDEEYMNIIGGEDNDESDNDGNILPTRIGGASGMSQTDASVDILQSLQTRIEQLEMKVTDTNAKLDLILAKLG
uniref:Ion transport domain-containing protein n=2 Tax=Skeletonema marinoi TaxID=267567 RepID=A0A7S2LZM1_9STRA|mmetsp:Transcript_3161/g.5187  ORF Transcript_3161/g.5187 Transcript_3161/m.5187 type:complete len:519 (+) Transcript_3161:237-1793(+)